MYTIQDSCDTIQGQIDQISTLDAHEQNVLMHLLNKTYKWACTRADNTIDCIIKELDNVSAGITINPLEHEQSK